MKYLASFFLLLTLVACGNEEDVSDPTQQDAPEDNFVIAGKINNGQNLNFYLEAQTPEGIIKVAETTSDGVGNFTMKGNIPGYGVYQLRMGETPEKVIPLTLVPKDNIRVEASYANFVTPKVSGARWTEVMTDYMKVYHEFVEGTQELKLNTDNLSDEEVNERYREIRADVDAFAMKSLNSDPANPFNFLLIASAFPQENFEGWDPENLTSLKRVEAALSQQFPKSPLIEKLSYQVYQLEQEFLKYQQFKAGTQPAPEIAMKNPAGEIIRLSDLKGKYVLVDFWASWCGPCRKENPNVVRLYNKYKDRGFTVFSVSLDEDPEAWKAAIAKDGLAWPNHCSDLLRWSSPVIQTYGFSGIPYTVLLNKEGNFIGVNLRGEELEQKLKEIFEK